MNKNTQFELESVRSQEQVRGKKEEKKRTLSRPWSDSFWVVVLQYIFWLQSNSQNVKLTLKKR